MLPRINVVVPTNEFYELSVDEARDLNDDGQGGGGDPIMGEPFQRDRGPNDADATFRVRSYAADGVTPVYQYYIARYLWDWARRGNRTDPRRNSWRYSDWMALRNQFEPNYPVPNWVRDLESADLRRVHHAYNETAYWNDNHTRRAWCAWRTPTATNTLNDRERRWLKVITAAEPYDENYRGSFQTYAFYDQPDPTKQNYNADSTVAALSYHPGKWMRLTPARAAAANACRPGGLCRRSALRHQAGDARGESTSPRSSFAPRAWPGRLAP